MARAQSLVLLVAACSCATAFNEGAATTVVPYRVGPSGRLLVDVHINEQGPLAFAIDTAATITAVLPRTQSDLGLTPLVGRSTKIYGAAASGVYPLVRVDRFDVGRETWQAPTLVALTGSTSAHHAIDGILGIDLLKRFAVGIFANPATVRLYPADAVRARRYRGWTSIPLQERSNGPNRPTLFTLWLRIGERRLPAVLDLGAPINLMNWAAVKRLGLTPRDFRKKATYAGALDTISLAARLKIPVLHASTVQWREVSFLVADLAIFETLVPTGRPMAIIGAAFLARRDFIVDFPGRRLLIRAAH